MRKRTHSESAQPPTIQTPTEPTPKRSKPTTTTPAPATTLSQSTGPVPSPQIPAWTGFTKWTSESITRTRPPLPAVLDPALETAALTHSGMRKNLSDPSYERLEWLGDVYLELISSELIAQTFPTLDPGRCSHYREMLVRNSTLGQFSVHYGLDRRANFPAEFGLGGRPNGTKASDKQRAKALGDIFEAYVGAIIRSDPANGLGRAAEWLKALWGPVLERHIRDEETGARVNDRALNPKTQLEQLIGAPGVKLEYRDLPSNGKKDRDTKQELFSVGCFLNGWGETGLQLGYGSALGKKEAGQKAAVQAMENKKLIKKFADKKKALMAARASLAEQEKEQAEKGEA
ncbi:ribonuclease III domain-containing protein [Staphylotrichum tortipilum]|uniref:Ribonuclease III domain-containing protein n=1 Tax=Staphylotrichum tortipilum TaxID=2831512 RepID=A0AAN6MN85_9PEZI|nr:ribonuclease III domain-containing protein [Staphylotrichum longicolle]